MTVLVGARMRNIAGSDQCRRTGHFVVLRSRINLSNPDRPIQDFTRAQGPGFGAGTLEMGVSQDRTYRGRGQRDSRS